METSNSANMLADESWESDCAKEQLGKLEVSTLKLSDYVVWYHSITDDNWDTKSYINLCKDLKNESVSTIQDISKIYVCFRDHLTSGMFFFMRKNILPIWEDKANINGGYISYKLSKNEAKDIWLKLTCDFVLNGLLTDPSLMCHINGISISPKISNAIIKVWISNKAIAPKLKFNTPYLDLSQCMYKSYK